MDKTPSLSESLAFELLRDSGEAMLRHFRVGGVVEWKPLPHVLLKRSGKRLQAAEGENP